jgi:GWxTD domain-containing protein
MKIIINLVYIIVIVLSSINLQSQNFSQEAVESFYFDAVVFQGDTLNIGRVDVLVLVPYQTLNFIKSGAVFGAAYEIDIKITDTIGNRFESSRLERSLRDNDYFVTKGGTGKFDHSQSIFYLKPGKYRITTTITDKFSKQKFEKKRIITVLDFGEFDYSISGILLLSSIEESGGKYKITPHISDNIGNLTSGFFAFFESYNVKHNSDSIDYVWEMVNSKDEVIAFSNRARRFAGKEKNQTFLHIPRIEEMTTGVYVLRITALQTDTLTDIKSGKVLAITQRSVNFLRTIGGSVLADLDIAIKQLKYIAFQSDIDFIKEATSIGEKQKRFETFWKKNDPSPGTDRNEAFEEYYTRINFANSTFKSYQDGWLTDKGIVYIIFGPPYSTDSQNNYNDGKVYERWMYMNNREFIFMDNSGFGDFRMIRPMSITEKYKYIR